MDAGTRQKVITLVGPGANESQIDVIGDLVEAQLVRVLKTYVPEAAEVPAELEHVVVEGVIRRYNRLGSEGISSESVEGYSASYASDGWLGQYAEDILAWALAVGWDDPDRRTVVRFL